ncbi:bifunctional adenosylcobinamide kinase/adenosylcobinamide-phosphate guanylyltransferase [Chloroflexota bacterium]
MKKNTLLIGGARSGKGRFALELARGLGGQVLFVATAEAGDSDMAERIENHRRERPENWRTLEVTCHVGNSILKDIGTANIVVLDCITLLVGNIFGQNEEQTLERIEESVLEKQVMAEISELMSCLSKITANSIIVTNDVGLGLVPINRVGRLYRDFLGKANQMLAQNADEVYLMIAGLPVKIKSLDKP